MKKTMETTKSICRIVLTFGTFTAAMVLLMASVAENNPNPIITFIGSLALFYAFHRLYERWKHSDKIIGMYDRWCANGIK